MLPPSLPQTLTLQQGTPFKNSWEGKFGQWRIPFAHKISNIGYFDRIQHVCYTDFGKPWGWTSPARCCCTDTNTPMRE